MKHLFRDDLGGVRPSGDGTSLLSLLVMSDIQVLDTVSPARCEWIELLADDPRWRPLLHMHRPCEALTHWAFAAHVQAARREPLARGSSRPYDLCLCLGDNIDNAQRNELDAFLAILAGGRTQLSARGGVHEPLARAGAPWPYWCPEPGVADLWKPRGYPAVPDFVERASATLVSEGLGFPWACLPGNHDVMRQGTSLPEPEIERIAIGAHKALFRPDGFDPADPLRLFVDAPATFSRGAGRAVPALAARRALGRHEWISAHVERGAAGYTAHHAQQGLTDAVIDTEHVRIVMLDSNHPAGDYQGSLGTAQLAWLDARLSEVDRQPGRLAVLASHHGSVSLVNKRGDDPLRQHADALTEVAHRHACVVAWLVGHRHLHEIRPHAGPKGGFWEISTGALIDWPVQTRSVEFIRHSGDRVEIVCTLIDHNAPPGSLAHLHHDLSRRFAGEQCARMQGRPQDGNVRLRVR
jgi:3',5'-cyclic AMP phosphodiesterase CpdA